MSFSGTPFSGTSGAEASGSAEEGCACSGASTTAEPPVWESLEDVMVSIVDSGLRTVVSSNKFIASVSARVWARHAGRGVADCWRGLYVALRLTWRTT